MLTLYTQDRMHGLRVNLVVESGYSFKKNSDHFKKVLGILDLS